MEGVLHVQPCARFGDSVEGDRGEREDDEDCHGGGHDSSCSEADGVGSEVELAFIGVGVLEALEAVDTRFHFVVAGSRDFSRREAGEEAEQHGECLAAPQPDVLAE